MGAHRPIAHQFEPGAQLSFAATAALMFAAPRPDRDEPGAFGSRLRFIEDAANARTVLEVVTADRPGLLARIGWSLADQGVRLQNAKISTFGERAEDVFFVTDANNRPLPQERLDDIRVAAEP